MIRHVSDTALWVAVYRADESDRPDALFHDPFARALAGPRGAEIVRALPMGQHMAWAMVVRTAVIDEMILRCVAAGVRTVLNLGAGLDTRAFRLKGLPADLRWLDVDLPDMTAYRQDKLGDAPSLCQHTHVAADLSDATERAAVLATARRGRRPVLVLTEGLLIYLEPAQVVALGNALHAVPEARWWIADLITPALMSMAKRLWMQPLQQANAAFRFSAADSAAFFARQGWLETDFRSTIEESTRLGRPVPHGSWWDWTLRSSSPATRAALRRMSGVALLERQST